MAQENTMAGRDLYVRITRKNGKSHVQHHRVWDGMRLLESLQAQHREPKDPDQRCTVAFATEAEYKAERTRPNAN
jgi:hypothetical protein